MKKVKQKEEKRILIIDDSPSILKEMRDIVEGLRYLTIEARSGIEALNKINEELPDLVILDIVLPDLDGFKILSHKTYRKGL